MNWELMNQEPILTSYYQDFKKANRYEQKRMDGRNVETDHCSRNGTPLCQGYIKAYKHIQPTWF